MSIVTTFLSDLKFAITHPATIRKELLAVATSVASDITALNTFVHLPGQLGAIVTAVQGIAVFLVSFLGNNQSVADAQKADALKRRTSPLKSV